MPMRRSRRRPARPPAGGDGGGLASGRRSAACRGEGARTRNQYRPSPEPCTMVRPIWSVRKYRLSSTRPWARSGTGPGTGIAAVAREPRFDRQARRWPTPAPPLADEHEPFAPVRRAVLGDRLGAAELRSRPSRCPRRDGPTCGRRATWPRPSRPPSARVPMSSQRSTPPRTDTWKRPLDPIGPRDAAGGALGGLDAAANRTAGVPTVPGRSTRRATGAGAKSVVAEARAAGPEAVLHVEPLAAARHRADRHAGIALEDRTAGELGQVVHAGGKQAPFVDRGSHLGATARHRDELERARANGRHVVEATTGAIERRPA